MDLDTLGEDLGAPQVDILGPLEVSRCQATYLP